MKTTQDCKTFLVDYFKATPDLISEIYGDEDGDEALADALVEKNWKRETKMKPGSENSYCDKPLVPVMTKGISYPSGPSYHSPEKMPVEEFLVERVFCLMPDKYDSAVRYIVLESKTGELFLGDYVGD